MEGAWAWLEAESQGSNKAGTQRRACIPVLSSGPVHSEDPLGSQRLWKQRGRLVFYWMSDLCNCQSHYVQRRGRELYFLVSSSWDRVLISSFLAWSHSTALASFLGLRPAGLKPVPPEASCEPCLPSACGYVPWESACFWTHYPSPSGIGCDKCGSQSSLIHGIVWGAGAEFSSSSSRLPSQAFKH